MMDFLIPLILIALILIIFDNGDDDTII